MAQGSHALFADNASLEPQAEVLGNNSCFC